MEWDDYLTTVLSKDITFDKVNISLDKGEYFNKIPPFIIANVLLLDKMMKQSCKNVLVFPEKKEMFLLFSLMYIFYNIVNEKIETNYNPKNFRIGDKLKIGRAIVEYRGTIEENNQVRIKIKLADCDELSAPESYFSVFQRVETKRPLSKLPLFNSERKVVKAFNEINTFDKDNISYVSSMKTHIKKSVYVVATVTGIKEQLSNCYMKYEKITNILYCAQVDYEGKISSISSGQMSGNPALVLSPDLYSIEAAISKGANIHSIIIDISNINAIENQLDVLDSILKRNINIIFITDIMNSFELDQLNIRNFNVWRWDKELIPESLYKKSTFKSIIKIGNCANHSFNCIKVDCKEINDAIMILSSHRHETKQQSSKMMSIYENLYKLTFYALRSVNKFSNNEIESANQIINDCDRLLQEESIYLSDNTTSEYRMVIDDLKSIYSKGYPIKKQELLSEYLFNTIDDARVILIIPNNISKKNVSEFWKYWCRQKHIKTRVLVVYPEEYDSMDTFEKDVTIVSGWLKRNDMRKILFGFKTMQYIVLLYNYEEKWLKYDERKWVQAKNNSSNRKIIENLLLYKTTTILDKDYNLEPSIVDENDDNIDELKEIELIIRDNRIKRYTNNGMRDVKECVKAIPVNFVGGYLAFYRTGHSVISVTKIILSQSNSIESKTPKDLNIGDFIVIREADKDLIRELADIALENSGKKYLRAEAGKWREALKIDMLFSTEEDTFNKLKKLGCIKSFATFKNWLEDESIIAPQSKDDLRIIADATENETLKEKLDEIFDAAQQVKKAHVLAGKKLSEQLKKTLANELLKYGEISPYNYWEPIEINIEGIGNVKVLQIIDIGEEVDIDPANTNHIIEG